MGSFLSWDPPKQSLSKDLRASSLSGGDPKKQKWGRDNNGDSWLKVSENVHLLSWFTLWATEAQSQLWVRINLTLNYPSEAGYETFIHQILSPIGWALNLCTSKLPHFGKEPEAEKLRHSVDRGGGTQQGVGVGLPL